MNRLNAILKQILLDDLLTDRGEYDSEDLETTYGLTPVKATELWHMIESATERGDTETLAELLDCEVRYNNDVEGSSFDLIHLMIANAVKNDYEPQLKAVFRDVDELSRLDEKQQIQIAAINRKVTLLIAFEILETLPFKENSEC